MVETKMLCIIIQRKSSLLGKSRGGRYLKRRSRKCGIRKRIRKHGRRPEPLEMKVLWAKFQSLVWPADFKKEGHLKFSFQLFARCHCLVVSSFRHIIPEVQKAAAHI